MAKFENKTPGESMLVDLDRIIRSKKSKVLKKMPQFVINYMKKLIHQDEINKQIIKHHDKYGLDFIKASAKSFDFSITITGMENLPDLGRFIFVCNHPLGGIDFYAALLAAREKYPEVKAIANDILMSFKNLQPLFLPINVFGRSPQSYYNMINDALASDIQVMIFPAGEVSRKHKGIIKDGPWHRSFIRSAIDYQRNVIPMYIHAENSKRFYRLGLLREKLGIKFNLELFLLPDELFRQKGKSIRVVVGKPIPYQYFDNSKSRYDWAQEIKETVYSLQNKLHGENTKEVLIS